MLSPRFLGPVAGALTSHPLLTLQSWDPWMPIKQLAVQLRTFLQARHCRVLGWHVQLRRSLLIRALCRLSMACDRPATCCADWITVILDLLQVTGIAGQFQLDVLVWDWSSAKELLGRHKCESYTTPVLGNRSQALTLPPLAPPRGPIASGTVEATHTRRWALHVMDTRQQQPQLLCWRTPADCAPSNGAHVLSFVWCRQ